MVHFPRKDAQNYARPRVGDGRMVPKIQEARVNNRIWRRGTCRFTQGNYQEIFFNVHNWLKCAIKQCKSQFPMIVEKIAK